MNVQRLPTKRNPSTDNLLNRDVLVERLLESLAERDQKLVQQLTILNQSILQLAETTKLQSTGMCQHLQTIAAKQEALLSVESEMLMLKKAAAQKPKVPFQSAFLKNQKRPEQLNGAAFEDEQIKNFGSPKEAYAQEFKFEGQKQQPVNGSAKKQFSKESQSDDFQGVSEKSAALPSRVALVPFQQKQIFVDVKRAFQNINKSNVTLVTAQEAISKWLAQVFDSLSRQSFSGFYSRHLSQADTKVYYTHNYSINFERMTEYFWNNHRQLWINHGQQLIEHFEKESSKALDFMMVKYPLKQKAYISDEIRNAIPTLDRSDEPEFDILRNTGCQFKYDPVRKEYHKQVKIFMNRIMTETQSHIDEFRMYMKDVFTISDGSRRHQLKNLIGMKFRENTPLYSPKEIEDSGIQIKSPQVLRVIIKWIEELQKKAKGLLDGTLIHNPFSTKDSTRPQYLNRFMKEYLAAFMAKKQPVLKQAGKQMRLRIRSMLRLIPEFLQKYMSNFKHIKETDVKSGLLSYTLAETASNLSVNYLLFLIDLLQQASKDAKRHQGTVQMTTTDNSGNTFKETVTFFDMQFATFTISDLLRCKCTGSLAHIKKVFDNLSRHPKFTVYRVKNRVDTSNKDFLVNVRLNGTPLLCEVQLAITDKSGDEKQEYLNHFSHFMYELSRASYGPIAEAVIINSYLTEFVPFFRGHLAPTSNPTRALSSDIRVQCSSNGDLSIAGYLRRNNDFSFICTNCLEFRVANSSHLVNFDSSLSILAHDELMEREPTVKKIICGDCAYTHLTPQAQSVCMLGQPLCVFFQATEKKILPNLVCAVQKISSVRKVRVLQKCTHGSKVSYVPTFYECKTDNFRVTEKNLKEKYYVFELKSKVQSYLPDTQRLARHLQSAAPQTPLYLPALFSTTSSVSHFPISKPLSILDNKQPSFLSSINAKSVHILDTSSAPFFLLVNTYHNDEELSVITKQGRQFKVGQIKTMRVSQIWQLQRSNLDNSSFAVFTDEVFVKEVNLQYNGLTDIHFMKSSTVKKIDLTGNHLQRLKLEIMDFPLLQFLNVSFNNIDRIEAFCHESLQTLLLSVNRINNLNQSEWILPNLTRLYLTNNQITKIDLSRLSLLKELQLGDNPLQMIQFPPMMPKLEDFYLYKNKFSVLSLSKVSFPSLRRLHICECNLKFLEMPRNLQSLEELVLQNNNLSHLQLPKDLSALSKMNLQKNNLEFFDMSKSHLPYLKELNLRLWSKSMIRVQQIILTRNMFTIMDLSDLPMYSLRNIYVASNYITSIKFPPQSYESAIAPELVGIYAVNNLLGIPIPSNVTIGKNRYFPLLDTIEVGVENLEVCALWLLRGMTKEDRQGIYQVLGVRTGELMEKQLNASWKDQDLSEDIRQEAVGVVQLLRNTGKIPKINLSSIEEMLSKQIEQSNNEQPN